MLSCFSKKNKEKKEIKTKEILEKSEDLQEFDVSGDTEEDLEAEQEWTASQYLSGDYQLNTNGIIKINKFHHQRKCIYCKYVEYHVSFLPLCTSAENYKTLASSNSIEKVVVFDLDESTYYHVECAPNWLCEIDLLWVPFPSSKKYIFVLLPKTSDIYEINYLFCYCDREKRIDPDRWEYYQAYEQ